MLELVAHEHGQDFGEVLTRPLCRTLLAWRAICRRLNLDDGMPCFYAEERMEAARRG